MREQGFLAVLIADSGREIARIALAHSEARDALPLRAIATAGLRHDASALVLIRGAADARCQPGSLERSAVNSARRTLGAIGLRLHDYILCHGESCVSLRLTGQL